MSVLDQQGLFENPDLVPWVLGKYLLPASFGPKIGKEFLFLKLFDNIENFAHQRVAPLMDCLGLAPFAPQKVFFFGKEEGGLDLKGRGQRRFPHLQPNLARMQCLWATVGGCRHC